ncbi:hypothetical protein GCM10023115_19110 [Pontixanthobacter gangjinensis]
MDDAGYHSQNRQDQIDPEIVTETVFDRDTHRWQKNAEDKNDNLHSLKLLDWLRNGSRKKLFQNDFPFYQAWLRHGCPGGVASCPRRV